MLATCNRMGGREEGKEREKGGRRAGIFRQQEERTRGHFALGLGNLGLSGRCVVVVVVVVVMVISGSAASA